VCFAKTLAHRIIVLKLLTLKNIFIKGSYVINRKQHYEYGRFLLEKMSGHGFCGLLFPTEEKRLLGKLLALILYAAEQFQKNEESLIW
jgi:hypothetical protein